MCDDPVELKRSLFQSRFSAGMCRTCRWAPGMIPQFEFLGYVLLQSVAICTVFLALYDIVRRAAGFCTACLYCGNAGKAPRFMPVWESSEESRDRAIQEAKNRDA